MYRRYGKRIFDLALSLFLLIVLLPVVSMTAIVVGLKLGRPVLYCRPRIGRDGRAFTLFKFRSMTDERGEEGKLLPDDIRLTRFGRLIRQLSLDELPQLLNVIRGDMSLVGPRPLFESYLDRYTADQLRRHEVRSGITGWAQVNGRNAISWDEKFRLDVWYVDNIGLWLDVKILWRTAINTLARQGIAAEGHATMPEFMGTKENS